MQIEEVDIKDIVEAEYNPRLISYDDKQQLKASLVKFGMIDPIILNSYKGRENILIGGHQRLAIWKELKHKKIPAIYVKLKTEDEKELNIRLNKNTGDFDYELLEKNFDTGKLVEWGFSPYQFGEVTFLDTSDNTIEHDINIVESPDVKSDFVSLEIMMYSEQKKAIMLKINKYKKENDVSNGDALFQLLNK